MENPVRARFVFFVFAIACMTGIAAQNVVVMHRPNETGWKNGNMDVSIAERASSEGQLQVCPDPGQIHCWNWTYGGADDDVTYALVQTSDGGYALAGYTFAPPGSFHYWLVKTDAVGIVQWSSTCTYGGYNDDVATALVQTSDGDTHSQAT